MNIMNMLKRKRNQLLLSLPLLGAFGVALGLGGCASSTNGATAQQTAQAQQLMKNAAGYLNPTSNSPTELEGTWLSQCTPGNFSQGAQSYTKGYIFMGNSFYRQ